MPNSLGTYLRELRATANLSTSQVARRADCADATVNLVERDRRRPSPRLLWRLTQAVNGDYPVALSWLAAGDGVVPEVCATLPERIRAATTATENRQ